MSLGLGIHMRLFEANVNVSAATGVVDGVGSFGYVIYVRADDYERAAKTLGARGRLLGSWVRPELSEHFAGFLYQPLAGVAMP